MIRNIYSWNGIYHEAGNTRFDRYQLKHQIPKQSVVVLDSDFWKTILHDKHFLCLLGPYVIFILSLVQMERAWFDLMNLENFWKQFTRFGDELNARFWNDIFSEKTFDFGDTHTFFTSSNEITSTQTNPTQSKHSKVCSLNIV